MDNEMKAKEMRGRLEFQLELIRRYGRQVRAAKELEMENSQITGLIQGRPPNWYEIGKLMRVFTPSEMKKFFGPRRKPSMTTPKIEGKEAVNSE
jgi:hypothetical protein